MRQPCAHLGLSWGVVLSEIDFPKVSFGASWALERGGEIQRGLAERTGYLKKNHSLSPKCKKRQK